MVHAEYWGIRGFVGRRIVGVGMKVGLLRVVGSRVLLVMRWCGSIGGGKKVDVLVNLLKLLKLLMGLDECNM